MAKNLIDVGINLNDGTGDNLRTAGTKINSMFQEVYDVFGDGTNLSNIASNLHIVNDIAPQLGGNLDMNGYIINGNGSINILSTITTSTNLIAVGAVQASTAAISGNSTFGGAVTITGITTGTVGNFTTSVTTGTLSATTELQVIGPASITGAITSGAAGSKIRFYHANVAAFPSATTYEGGLAFAEDTNRMYFATDTNWLSLAPELDPAFTGTPTAPTAIKATNTTQIATTAHVKDVVSDYAPLASPSLTGVPLTTTQSTGTRAATGASTQIANSNYVRAVASEIYTTVDLKSPIASPAFTGIPTAPTATAGTNTTQLSTTAFVTTAINNFSTTVTNALALKAPLASPTFTGAPAAPTPDVGNNSTRVATTEYVGNRIDAKFNDDSYLTDKLSAYAKKASPALTGVPTSTTAAAGTNNTQIATTAFVKSSIDTYNSGANLSQYALINSQAFTGTPTVPTPSDNNNSLAIANTAFVQNWTATYGNVPKWGGSRKYVSTATPTSSDGVDGDIWFQIQS